MKSWKETFAPFNLAAAAKSGVMADLPQRRRFRAEYKRAIIAETMQPGLSITFVARRHGLSPGLVFRWRRQMKDDAREMAPSDDVLSLTSDTRQLADRVRELERVLGRKIMEIEALKEALKLSRAANAVVRSPLSISLPQSNPEDSMSP